MVQHENDHSGEEHTDERDSGSVARIVRLISGEYLLTVNPVDGSEIEPCPPGQRPGTPHRRAADDRPGVDRPTAVRAQPPALLERDEERERLARLLGRGRSVRLTGPRGSGRTALLDAVADDVAEMAPDGVVRLSGYRRTVTDVLQDLFAAVYDAPEQRPDRRRLREALSTVGAVVILDDLEFGGGTLDELLTATPECAYLVAATPDVAAPSEKARIDEMFLPGLSRTGSVDLLEGLLDRPLTDDESDWAGDLWFLSEGKPLTFVQAATLLRQQGGGTAVAVYGEDEDDGGLPSGADIAAEVARRLSRCAQGTLRVAAALGGELPKGAHLPALLNEDHADDAPVELADAGLVTEAGGHFRLAHGVAGQLRAEADDELGNRVESIAHHYAWWVAHPSVTAARVAAEADAVVAAVQAAQREGRAEAAVLLARAAAPILAAASRRGAWERLLRSGQEAARTAGEVAEQAYFHHELGVLALCQGNPERAQTELEASIALRAALADKHGTVTGRRALALVTDRLAGNTPGSPGAPDGPTIAGAGALGGAHTPGAVPGRSQPAGGPVGPGEPAAATGAGTGPADSDHTPTAATPKALYSAPTAPDGDEDATAAALSRAAAMDDSIAALRAAAERDRDAPGSRRRLAVRSTRKNVLAAGAGAALAAVLGTVVTLGAASDSTEEPSGGPNQPERSSSLTDDYSDDDPAGSPTDGSEPVAESSPTPAAPGPSSEATPDPAATESPGGSGSSKGSSTTGGGSGAPGDSTDGGGTDGGSTDGGSTDGGSTDGGSTDGGSTDGGGTDGGSTDGGSTDGGSTDGGSTDGGNTDGGSTDGGSTDGGNTDGGSTDGGSTDGGSTDGGNTGGSTTGSTPDGGTSSSPTASGPAPSTTPGGTSTPGTASGGAGGPVA